MRLSFKQTLLIIIIILAPLVFSMLPFAIQSFKTPPDRVFMGLHRWSEDYYGYLHTINEGLMGHLKNVNKITLEPHPATFIHSEYAFLGLTGRIFGLNSALTYHLSRLVLGAIFLLVSLYFFYFLFTCQIATPAERGRNDIGKKTFLAFFLAFFVGGFPNFSLPTTIYQLLSTIHPYLPWWVELDVTRRSTILPHYLMGNIFFLLILIFFLKYISNLSHLSNLKSFIVLAVFSLFLSFVHPVDYLILVATLSLFTLFNSLILKFFNSLIPFFTVLFAGIIPIFYYQHALTLPFWRFILGHGTTTKYNIPLFDFVMALGPVFFLAFGGIFLWARKATGGGEDTNFSRSRIPSTEKSCWIFQCRGILTPQKNFVPEPPSVTSQVFLLLFCWLLVQAAFFLKLYEVFNFDRLRTMQAPYYIPLAFFATIFLMSLRAKRNDKLKFLLIIIISVFLLSTFPLSISSLNTQIHEVSDFKTFSPFIYPTKKQYQSWLFLRDHTPENSAITTMYEERFLLPAVAGNKIALGANFDNDSNYGKNLNIISQIYQNTLNSQTAYKFLKENLISYLYWGYQEKSYGGDLTKYAFLQKIFDNGEVTIFAVK